MRRASGRSYRWVGLTPHDVTDDRRPGTGGLRQSDEPNSQARPEQVRSRGLRQDGGEVTGEMLEGDPVVGELPEQRQSIRVGGLQPAEIEPPGAVSLTDLAELAYPGARQASFDAQATARGQFQLGDSKHGLRPSNLRAGRSGTLAGGNGPLGVTAGHHSSEVLRNLVGAVHRVVGL